MKVAKSQAAMVIRTVSPITVNVLKFQTLYSMAILAIILRFMQLFLS